LLSILDRPLSTISAEVWINKDENRQTGASMELRIESGRQTVFSRSLDIDNFVLKKNRWYRVSDEFGIPPWIDQNISNFKISIENPKGSKFFIDDLQLGFR